MLREEEVFAGLRVAGVAEAEGAEDGAGLNDDVVAKVDALADGGVGSDGAVVADDGAGFDDRSGGDVSALADAGGGMDHGAGINRRRLVFGGEGFAGERHGEAGIANPEHAGVVGLEVAVTGEDGAGAGLNGALEGEIVLCEDDGVRRGVAEGGDAVEIGFGHVLRRCADEGGEFGEGESIEVAWFQLHSLRG